ncbi:MAG: DUF885 domain-containing protein [Wenzhouxiangellaceae bacterium]|nr:DUF885 domain-containing protein [Wenzhouxiangellaceae bacterium]
MIRGWLLAAALLGASLVRAGMPAEAFDRLVADYEAQQLADNPLRAVRHGDLEAAARWPDRSFEAVERGRQQARTFFERLQNVDADALDGARADSYAVLHYLLQTELKLAPFAPERMPFVNDSGFFSTPLWVASSTRLRTPEQAEAWLKRLAAVPDWLAQHRAWLARGIETGFTQPEAIVDDAIAIVQAIAETPPAESPLLAPLRALPLAFDPLVAESLRTRALEILLRQVVPAYRELATFLREQYRPAARASIGIAAVPEGRAYYRALLRQHTTIDTTPEAVHQRGLAEVARIREQMDAVIAAVSADVIAETGFEGGFAEFIEFLRTDPRFYADTPEELLRHAAWIAKRADDRMPEFFGRLPRLPYGVRPVPEHLAPTYTTGRYWVGDPDNGVAGGFMVNTYRLDQRPLYTLPALTLHEAVPGHHHMAALTQENGNLPEFRRRNYITAFGEGWALYTEHLGIEMGIYTTPYEHFGRLTYEMWRACRLLVDTGIHYFDWTREQAEACFLENSALSPHNVRTEVSRYIAWPGQALAYKTGELLIRELRARAEQQLGPAFDLRAFHDAILERGALPLPALEARIEQWIAARKSG